MNGKNMLLARGVIYEGRVWKNMDFVIISNIGVYNI